MMWMFLYFCRSFFFSSDPREQIPHAKEMQLVLHRAYRKMPEQYERALHTVLSIEDCRELRNLIGKTMNLLFIGTKKSV